MIRSGDMISETIRGWKLLLLLLIAFINYNGVNAQTDTLQYSEEIQEDSMVQYLTPLEYAFMMHEETPWMVKANMIITLNYGQTFKAKLSFENKIAKGFSLNTTLQYIFGGYEQFGNNDGYNAFTISLAPRWYYGMAKSVKAGKSKWNLSGNYFSIGATYWNANINSFYRSVENLNFFSIYGKWGIQHRFLKRGYIDFGIKAEVSFYSDKTQPTSYSISTYMDAGFAFAKDKQKLNKDALCSVLRCYESDRFLIKANLINFLSLGVYNNELSIAFNPEVAFEIKLGQSPFSLNANIRVQSGYNRFNYRSYFRLFTLFESRWYYNLNKRLLKGKTGNGLSANYIAFGIYNQFIDHKSIDRDRTFDIWANYNGIQLVTGIQRTYSEHFYFDINVGYEASKRTAGYYYWDDKIYLQFKAFLAVGYRF